MKETRMPPVTIAAVAGDTVAIIALSVLLYADKIPLEFFTATFASLVVARGLANRGKGDGDGKGGGGISPGAVSGLALLGGLLASYLSRGRIAITTIALSLMLMSCQHERPVCSPAALAAIEGAYLDEVLVACEGQSFEGCHARPAIERRYEMRREAWARCR